jgi:hypothetical protein
LREEKLFLDRGLEQPQVDRGPRPELGEIEFFQALIEASQARQLRIDRQPGVFIDAAVVFVEAEVSRMQRARGEITANEFLGDVIELDVGLD